MLLLLIVIAVCAAVDVPCATPNGLGPNPNACADAVSGSGDPLPNCMNVSPTDGMVWMCTQCSHNCDCQIGQYCEKGPGRNAGSCLPLAEDVMIGKPCMIFGIPGTSGAIIPIMGYNDHLVCGAPVFNATGTFLRYDWVGSCIHGICNECDGGTVPWSMAASWMSLVPSTTAIPGESGIEGWLERDGGTLLCPQRFCRDGKISGGAALDSYIMPHEIVAAILGFVIIITFFLCCILFSACCGCDIVTRLCKKQKYQPKRLETDNA
jgi:hypothetical protein